MPTFDISDITPVGAYVSAVAATQDSDRRNANRRFESGDDLNATKFLTALVRRLAAAITENRRTASRLISRPI